MAAGGRAGRVEADGEHRHAAGPRMRPRRARRLACPGRRSAGRRRAACRRGRAWAPRRSAAPRSVSPGSRRASSSRRRRRRGSDDGMASTRAPRAKAMAPTRSRGPRASSSAARSACRRLDAGALDAADTSTASTTHAPPAGRGRCTYAPASASTTPVGGQHRAGRSRRVPAPRCHVTMATAAARRGGAGCAGRARRRPSWQQPPRQPLEREQQQRRASAATGDRSCWRSDSGAADGAAVAA